MLNCVLPGEENQVCLPDMNSCDDFSRWNEYLKELYVEVFKRDFLDSFPIFQSMEVHIRKEPMDGEFEHGFIHMTHEDHYHKSNDRNDRVPDIRRAERLPWARRVIENYECSVENDCGRILYWEEFKSNSQRVRVNLLFKEEKYLVVLEKTKREFLLITGFYLDKEWELEKRIKKYKKYKQQKTPLT